MLLTDGGGLKRSACFRERKADKESGKQSKGTIGNGGILKRSDGTTKRKQVNHSVAFTGEVAASDSAAINFKKELPEREDELLSSISSASFSLRSSESTVKNQEDDEQDSFSFRENE